MTIHYQTELLTIDPIHPDSAIIDYAASLLHRGELVVFPTETVYGLGADALQVAAVEAIFAAKGRPFHDPLIVHIADIEELDELVVSISETARLLAQTFWPGPLTLILPASARVSSRVTAHLPTVAVRMPRHPVAHALIQATGSPIAAPSANRFMHVSPTTAQHVWQDLAGRVPLILDAGPCTVGVESTILDLSKPVPTILRPGGISLEALRTLLPEVQAPQPRTKQNTGGEEEKTITAPGQMLVHYAPAVPTYLYEGEQENIRTALLAEVQQRTKQGERVGLLLAQEDSAFFAESSAHIASLGSLHDPDQLATNLFAGLRTLEEAGVQVILCRSFAEQGLGLAIRDRLLKASGGKVIYC
ncbi:MAG TPA: L-threonylcarbamoyladenylate synthase [Ktedonobacteraceae bacterium]|jgi:L-threonylcarbamoyladenylate synthase|nr:L-threonylcarbamoyladenylate synthase [Ktedonobacteraceae bacterium]